MDLPNLGVLGGSISDSWGGCWLTAWTAPPRIYQMPAKNTSQTVWMLIVAVIVALFLYASFAGRAPKPQPDDEFPSEQVPPST